MCQIELLVCRFQCRLDSISDVSTKKWFDNYLRGAIQYRGVKTPQVRQELLNWVQEEDVLQLSFADQLRLVCFLLQQDKAEDKCAGTLYIQKYLLKNIPLLELLYQIEQLFLKGYFFDWATTDGLCLRVLCFIVKKIPEAKFEMEKWSLTSNLWQRRASIVSFLKVVDDVNMDPFICRIISRLVMDQERFIQTGIGWLIASLSKVRECQAEQLVNQYFDDLSKEVIFRHTKHMNNYSYYLSMKKS